jgi:hypothetical protein
MAKGERLEDIDTRTLTDGLVVSIEARDLAREILLSDLPYHEQSTDEWHGVITSEAATTFSVGGTVIRQPEVGSLAEAKDWVVFKLAELLTDEEQVSQAVVLCATKHNVFGYELMPSTWPMPGCDVVAEWSNAKWIEIEVDGEEA